MPIYNEEEVVTDWKVKLVDGISRRVLSGEIKS
jgi:hypothetical protein